MKELRYKICVNLIINDIIWHTVHCIAQYSRVPMNIVLHTAERVMMFNNKGLFLLPTGCLMRVPDADVRNQLVDTVKSFYNSVAPIELLDGMEHLSKPKPRTFNSDIYFSRLSLSEALSWLLSASVYLLLPSFFNRFFFSPSSAHVIFSLSFL